ncbi:peptidyl-dipeptidase Dcp [Prevotella sp. ne3005]|uniref:M3 family metallopeptidase n=1 Tax=Prevotella sp. ne3005 TaxID=1761887 RepID=UPI0008B58820|nr:M3 family metallopeptidase [Prevotella sp. ne3005]SEN08737.1 peptidyl-dipeptidase Dcp [Prevotella sp. ne3005]
MNENKERTNPFFLPYNTPHDTAPFDRIRMEDYEEAMLEGIRREDEQIDKIVNNPAKPTFDNTIISVDDGKDGEDYYNLLDRVSTVFFNLLSAETNDEMDALAQKMSPILTKHSNDIRLNEKLFERIKYVHRHHRKLSPEEKMLLDNCYDGFVRNGALLDAAGKERLRQLTEEISVLGLQFSQNLLKENKAFTLHLTDEAQLDGLPETAREAAALAAKEQGKEGWVFTLDFPSYLPFMTYSTQRELRRQLYMAKNTECIHDNTENNLEICKRIINLRRELAQLLGHNSYADYVLKHRMAGNVRNVYKLFNDLIKAYKPTAQKEVAAIEKMARQLEGKNFKLEPWDFGFYSHKLQLQKFNIDAEMLRPYFELSKVIDGVFGLANRLYGITFKENKDIPVYHPDVKAYEVFDEDGSFLAVFYADFHPRKGKQGGAWMTSYQGQWMECEDVKKPFGPGNIKNVRPHVSVVMNLTKPTEEKPALLTLSEVETFLHEFGHSLHGMFANTRFESLSGTSVWWDFVELPSQFMENFAIEKEFLRTFAFHYKTGEPIPDDLIGRIVKSRNYNVAYTCMRQVGFGLLDMAYYTKKDEFTDDIIPFEKKAWEKAQILPQLPDTCMTVQFSHIMAGGYAAGYYSYKWAEVLDADAFAVFKKHGVFDKKTARSFRENILSKGGTENPMTLYKRFKGDEPTIDALLKRNGIKTTKTR